MKLFLGGRYTFNGPSVRAFEAWLLRQRTRRLLSYAHTASGDEQRAVLLAAWGVRLPR